MNATIEQINRSGQAFVEFALPMLIQSGVLILILLSVDLLLRKKVRAVFRYWIWMLVLVKLLLPTSLSSPVSVGRWFADERAYVDAIPAPAPQPQTDSAPMPRAEAPPVVDSQPVETIERAPAVVPDEPTVRSIESTAPHVEPASALPQPESVGLPAPPVTPLSWQGGALLVWLAVLIAMLLLLLQRALFVRRLVAQASDADRSMTDALEHCRQRMKMNKKVGLKVSAGATSPAVCGLFKPVILVPENLTPSLSADELRVVLLHELAHIKRGDLWVNLAQTILQIFYFYNPLLWPANAMIRRAREQAVDEMVLVAMGDNARQYPETLVNVAKLAFKRPALSLRLIGVVESKSALTGRIKHILNRPIPKTARLGILGLLALAVAAAVLLPMAKSDRHGLWFGRRSLVKFSSDDKPTGASTKSGDTTTYSKNYTVKFRKGEELAIIAELYQVGKPMRTLGCKIFSGSETAQKLSVVLKEMYANEDKTSVEYDLKIALGDQVFRLDGIPVNTPEFFNSTIWNFFEGSEIAAKKRNGEAYAEFESLLRFRFCPNTGNLTVPRIWMPTYGAISWIDKDAYFISVKMLALSQLDNLHVDVTHSGERIQLPDGTYLSADSTTEQRRALADDYLLSIRRALVREQMPLPELTAHKYNKVGEPIHFYMDSIGSDQWKPRLDEIYHGGDVNPIFVLIDGREYPFRRGLGPFSGGGCTLGIPDSLYVDDFHLPPGKHTFAYGWKDLDVVNLDDPDRVVHYERLTTDVAEFEVVEQIPADYYAEVYQEGWEEILRRSIETPFTDDMRKYHTWGTLFALQIGSLPFDIAFEIYAQAEGSAERVYAGSVAWQARLAGSYLMGCDHNVDEINWDTVGQKRWRLILVPSRKVAMRRPPIRHYYGREFVTEWATFEKSDRFEENRRRAYVRDILDRNVPRGAGSIRADKPVDLDGLTRRRRGDTDEAWPLPEGFDLGWSPDKGGTLRIDPKSNVRMLWFPEADASLSKVRDETRQRLVELPDSTTSEINPPMGERTLLAVRSSEGRDYFVRLKKIKETWADLSWWPARGVDDGPFGRIVDTSERPVRGATLVFSREDTTDRDPQKITVTAETLGGFILPAMKPGESLAASISAPGFESLKSVHIERLSDGTYLPKDLTFKVRRFGAVSGSVTGPDGKPLAGAPLSVTTVVAGPDLSDAKVTVNHLRAISRGGGRFGIMGVPPGTHLLYYPWGGPSTKEIEDGEWLPPHGPGDRRPSAPVDGVLGAKVVKVAYDQKVKNTVIDLSKSTCSAEGRVRDSAGRPIGGAKVCLCWKVPGGAVSIAGEGYDPAVTDSGGQYRLENLPPGDWHIWAWHDRLRRSDAAAVRLAPGETTQCDLTIGGPLNADAEAEDHLFSAYGTVTDKAGRPIAGAQLWADCGHDKLQRTGRAVTDQDGRYELVLTSSIKNVGADPYDVGIQTARIEARAKGYYEVNLCRAGNLAFSGKPPTVEEQRFVADYAGVVLPHEPYELNFVMRPAAQIEGEYVDERGRPIKVRTVWLHGDGLLSNTTLSGFSGTSGKFTIDHIPCGSVWFRDFGRRFIDTRTLTLPRPGVYRLRLQSGTSPTGRRTLRITQFHPPAFDAGESARRPVVDPNGSPVAGAQVALCTKDKRVIVRAGKLVANPMGGETTKTVETDADGLFEFSNWPDDFHLVAAHDKGFGWLTKEQFTSSPEIRLESWGRIEGRLYIGRDSGADERVALMKHISKVRCDYETRTDAKGDFAFDKVPPGWLEIGYMTRMGRSSWSYTCRTPLQIKPGLTFRLPLGGTGRPVIGRFVPPPDYDKEVYFGEGLRALDTVRPERPKPENYDRMSKRQQQDWYKQWRKTPEAEAFYDSMWHDPGRRQYVFHIEPDGMFRIDDVIAGKYKFTVWIEEELRGGGERPEEIASYYGALEVSEMPGGRSDEPLDVGELVLTMHPEPLRVGDAAPLFEARTLAGEDLKLIDYRGKHVLLSFWQPVFHPEIEQLREQYDTYHPGGRLAIIGLGGSDTLEEVRKYVEEKDIPWPQIYTGEDSKSGIAKEYALPGMPWIFLVGPDGKIIAKNLRGEKLKSAVRDSLGAPKEHGPGVQSDEPLDSDSLAAGESSEFEPVIELTVNVNSLENAYVDLDTGTLISYPKELATDSETELPWRDRTGIDIHFLTADRLEIEDVVHLGKYDLIEGPVPGDIWDGTRADVMIAAKKAEWEGTMRLHPADPTRSESKPRADDSALIPTFVIKTNKGNVGVLQVPEVIREGQWARRVKIRYKMLRAPSLHVRDEDIAWGEAVDGVQCKIQMVGRSIAFGENIEFDLVYRNVSDRPITVYNRPDGFWQWITYEARNRRGEVALRSPIVDGFERALELSDFKTLRPGQTASNRHLIDKSFMGNQPPEPGRYMLKVEINRINWMDEVVPGFVDFCRRHDLKPWTGAIASGTAYFEIASTQENRGDKPERRSQPKAEQVDAKAWGEPLNGLRMRVTAPAGTVYRRGMSLPLVLEIQNVGEQPFPLIRLSTFLSFKVTGERNSRLGVSSYLRDHIAGWESVDGTLEPGEIIRETCYLERLRFEAAPTAKSITLRFQLPTQKFVPDRLPITTFSNPVTIQLEDTPFDHTLKSEDLPETWVEDINIVYREIGFFAGNMAIHIDGKGRVTTVGNRLRADAPIQDGRHEYVSDRSELDLLVRQLGEFKIERLNAYDRKMFATDLVHVHLSLAKGGHVFSGEYELLGPKTKPVAALRRIMQDFLVKIVAPNRAQAAQTFFLYQNAAPSVSIDSGHAEGRRRNSTLGVG